MAFDREDVMGFLIFWIMQKRKVHQSQFIMDSRTITVIFHFVSDKMDEEVIQDGVRVIIDKKAQLTLLGTDSLFYTIL